MKNQGLNFSFKPSSVRVSTEVSLLRRSSLKLYHRYRFCAQTLSGSIPFIIKKQQNKEKIFALSLGPSVHNDKRRNLHKIKVFGIRQTILH